jgi:hypothetical protein
MSAFAKAARFSPSASLVWSALACATLVAALPPQAYAHVGAMVTPARITSPPRLSIVAPDGGAVTPLLVADTTVNVAWEDGDVDPTGRYYFYYLDHRPTAIITTFDVKAIATPIPEGSGGIWISCTCSGDAGVICPDAGVRDCRNAFAWDTSALPTGSYWVIAVDLDPPFNVYTVSETPVRVAHGGAPPPPAVVLLHPNGIGIADARYDADGLIFGGGGSAPLTVDFEYGASAYPGVLDPTSVVERAAQPTVDPDGRFRYVWDTSAIGADDVYLRARVTDGLGRTVYSDSDGVGIAHGGDGGVVIRFADLGAPPPKKGGCDVAADGGGGGLPLYALLASPLFVGVLLVRLRRRRS